MNIARFLKYNKSKKMTVESFCYAAFYRFCVLFMKPKKLRPYWGEEGRESAEEETHQNYCQAAHISQIVNRYCDKTAWESKCLVRALTAQRMLSKRNIHSTLYLGCTRRSKTDPGGSERQSAPWTFPMHWKKYVQYPPPVTRTDGGNIEADGG